MRHRFTALLLFVLVLLAIPSCSTRPAERATAADAGGDLRVDASQPSLTSATQVAGDGPVRVDKVEVPNDLPAFVVRGAREHRTKMLFIPGMCVHPEGYLMSFAHAAAERGELVAPQGDVSCGGNSVFRMWSSDLDAMDRRIDAAFEAAGLGEPRDLIIIGYSQGAERAEKLVAKWPAKYSRAILIASPITPSPSPLSVGRAKAVVLMAGTFDISRDRLRLAAPTLERARIPATYIALPNARHGQMGDTPDETMRVALDWVEHAHLSP